MIRSALVLGLLFFISCGIGGTPALCEEACPIVVTAWEPKGEALEETLLIPVISATVSSVCGADIDQSSIKMTLNENLVPHTVSGDGSAVTATFIPDDDLESDVYHDVTVHAEDVNGEAVDFKWTFYLPFYY